VDSGAQNVALPELEEKVKNSTTLTEQDRDLLRKVKKSKEEYYQQQGLY